MGGRGSVYSEASKLDQPRSNPGPNLGRIFFQCPIRRSSIEFTKVDGAVGPCIQCWIENSKECPAGIVVFRYAIFPSSIRSGIVAGVGLFAVLLPSPIFAAGKRPAGGRDYAIVNAQILDVRTGQTTSNTTVMVAKGRIISLTHDPVFSTNVQVIHADGFVLLPGLIDCHVHLLGNQGDQSAASSLRISSALGALWGVRNGQVILDHGFTTLRDAGEGDPAYGQLALRDAIAQGLVQGPRIFSAGGWVSVTGGHGDSDVLSADQALPRRPNIADTVDQVAEVVRRDLKYGADWIKLMATGGVHDPYSSYDRQELSEPQMARAVELAHRAGKRVMAHAEGAEGIKAAVRAGVDSIEHGTMLDEEGAALMEQRGTWLVPTLYTFQRGVEVGTTLGADDVVAAKGRAILSAQQPAFELAIRHHLKIAYGVDDEPELESREFGALVKGGLTPLQAIQTATVNAATLLGADKELGTIEVGKSADLILVEGNPLNDISAIENVRFVMKAGEIMRNRLGN